MRRAVLCATMFVLTICASRTLNASTADIVSRFFPNALATDPAGVVPDDERRSKFVTADLDHDGSQLIAAVYLNGAAAGVAVISPANGGTLLGSIVPPGMVGIDADVRLIDLNGDNRPEIVVLMKQSRGLPIGWIFGWNGTSLTLVSPTDEDGLSEVADPTFVAIENGIAVIVHHGGTWCEEDQQVHASETYRLLQWSDGGLHESFALDYFATFVRASGSPASQTVTCELQDGGARRQLVVVNGDYDGHRRVSSAEISINGQPVIGPSVLNQNVAVVRVAAPLATGDNKLAVKLAGEPGGRLNVMIIPAAKP